MLRARSRKRIPLDALRAHLYQAYPELQGSSARGERLLAELTELAAAGHISLPSGRQSWEAVGSPPLPKWILVRDGQPPVPRKDFADVAWAPELGFWTELSALQLEALQPINAFLLARRGARLLVPIKERSLEIFGDEKRLDALCTPGTDTLFLGRLSLSTLGCFKVAQPLPYRQAQAPGRPVLVVENHNSYWSFGEWNHAVRQYAAVVYGSGEAFRRTGTALEQVLLEVGGIGAEYLGDLDPKGVSIPIEFNRSKLPASPKLEPCIWGYRWLMTHGRTRSKPECALGNGAASTEWLGPEMGAQVAALWQAGQWIPQESLGFERLVQGCCPPPPPPVVDLVLHRVQPEAQVQLR
nr:Wadjet anti-phage system protein JetD domain-containing protein [Variovorax sp. dw_954]